MSLNKDFEERNSANSQRQGYYYANERWRDIKIALIVKLAKAKSYLLSLISDEICKPTADHKPFIEIRDAVELLVSMVEMAYGLPYKHEDHTAAIILIDAQLEKIKL